MTRRSKPKPDCTFCKGAGIISVSKDPDLIDDCVCTDPPERIRLSRRAGWRMPSNAVSVARPHKWGNPWRVGDVAIVNTGKNAERIAITPALAVELFRQSIIPRLGEVRAELAGKHLACFCKLGDPCHADVLLELANGGL